MGSNRRFRVGIKKRGAEEESTPSVSTRKTPRSNNSELLQERSDEVIAQLLDCLAACLRQNDIFALAITGTPLVEALPKHVEMLASIDENVKQLRDRLRAASEAVQEFSHLHADRVSFHSLNLMELAAQQRRIYANLIPTTRHLQISYRLNSSKGAT